MWTSNKLRTLIDLLPFCAVCHRQVRSCIGMQLTSHIQALIDNMCCAFKPVCGLDFGLHATGIFPVLAIFQHLPDSSAEPKRVEPPNRHDGASAGVRDPRGHSRLVVGNWYRKHGHSGGERFKSGGQASMRYAERGATEEFPLRSVIDCYAIPRKRTYIVHRQFGPDRQHQLAAKTRACLGDRAEHVLKAIL